MKHVETRVVLQYEKAGTSYGHGTYIVSENDAEMFVAIDRDSGGYPYAVPLSRAHNFVTEEKARAYASHDMGAFIVRTVTVTYEY